MSDFQFISTSEQLQQYCREASSSSTLCIDTEFVRIKTLFPQAGLFQLFDGKQVAIVDPLSIDDLNPLWSILTDTNILKVIHSCSEDIELFAHVSGQVPTPLLDTQIAAAFLGLGASVGYSALVSHYQAITLDKGEARTNWLQRPLTDKQLHYAANDVLHLLPCFEKLYVELKQKQLLDIVLDETQLIVNKRLTTVSYDEVYKDVKSAWMLRPNELAILKPLAAWRQKEAERKDLALNFVVREETLIAIAKARPRSFQQLQKIPEVKPNEARIHGKRLLQLVDEGINTPKGDFPQKIRRLADFPQYKALFAQAKSIIRTVSEESGFTTELLASKRQINQVFSWFWRDEKTADYTPELFQGWRKPLLAERLSDMLEE